LTHGLDPQGRTGSGADEDRRLSEQQRSQRQQSQCQYDEGDTHEFIARCLIGRAFGGPRGAI
jgi:hypothetical protein